jgi:competence protein ComEA
VWARLVARVPVRLDPGRRAAVAVGLAVLVAAVITGVWVLAERPRALAVSASAAPIPGAGTPLGTSAPGSGPSATSPAPGSSAPSSPDLVVVDVAGKVHRPGLYRLPSGARVDDALKAAGGPLAGVDLTSLNLAARVVDGQQIPVGLPGAGSGAGPPAANSVGSTPGAGAGPIDLNTATLDQLETLPGVGPVLGQHILDWRDQHGQFTSIDQLQDVTGIGPAKFAEIKGLVSL